MAPQNIDLQGPLNTWNQFVDALKRGDKDAAMKQLTPGAQERFSPVYDALQSGKPKEQSVKR